MRAALCCNLCVAEHGHLKAKRLLNIAGIATTVFQSSPLSQFPRSGNIWGCTFISIPTISAQSKWCRFSKPSTSTWGEGLFWFWIVISSTARQFVCFGENIQIGFWWNGFRRMLLILILWRGFGTIANIRTWPTLFQPMYNIYAESWWVRSIHKNVNRNLFCLTSNMQSLNYE